jgi:hypothetical protein
MHRSDITHRMTDLDDDSLRELVRKYRGLSARSNPDRVGRYDRLYYQAYNELERRMNHVTREIKRPCE